MEGVGVVIFSRDSFCDNSHKQPSLITTTQLVKPCFNCHSNSAIIIIKLLYMIILLCTIDNIAKTQ